MHVGGNDGSDIYKWWLDFDNQKETFRKQLQKMVLKQGNFGNWSTEVSIIWRKITEKGDW